jgi:hypothetical protein
MVRQWLRLSFLVTPQWTQLRGVHPSYLLGVLMAIFYFARWSKGQMPASTKGLLWSPEDFYGYSAILSPFVWPVLTRITAHLLKILSNGDEQAERKFSYAYSVPLLIWLGCFEFFIWSVCPPSQFGLIALCVMFIAMMVVYIQCSRLFDRELHSHLSRHVRTMLALLPQLLLATLIFR